MKHVIKKGSLVLTFVGLLILVFITANPISVLADNAGWLISGNNIYMTGGKVGIGNSSPARTLHISASYPEIQFTNTNSSNKSWHLGGLGNNFALTETGVASQLVVKAGGNVGIGTTNPANKLDVSGIVSWKKNDSTPIGRLSYDSSNNALIIANGNLILRSGDSATNRAVINTTGMTLSGTMTASSYACSSDRRFKKEIKPINNSLDKLTQLEGVSYYWKTDEFKDRAWPKTEQIGLIAQDVEKILPQVVITDSDGYKSVDYDKLSALIINAVKEQQSSINELKKQNQELKEELELIKEKLGIR